MKATNRLHFWLTGALIHLFCWVGAQTGEFQISFEQEICQSFPVVFQLSNTSDSTISNGEIEFSFPSCLGFDPTSLEGASLLTSGSGSLTVQLPELPVGNQQEVDFQLFPSCSCLSTINTGVDLMLEANVQISDTSLTQSAPFVLSTPFVVFTDLTNGFFSGQQFDVFSRTFSLTNTGSTRVATLQFTDEHQGGIDISIPNTSLLSQTATSIEVEIGASFIALFGNGDDWLDPGETLIIEEIITILGCGTPLSSSTSFIEAGWGCGTAICQSAPQTAIVSIQESTFVPNIQVTPSASSGNQFCGPEEFPQSLLIRNTGNAPASDLTFSLDQVTPTSGIDAASFQVDSAGIITSLLPMTGEPFETLPACTVPSSLYQQVDFLVPSLAPGDSVWVSWNNYSCGLGCNQPDQQWIFEYQYRAPCPIGSTISVDTQLVVANSTPFNTLVQGPIELLDGTTHFWDYQVDYPNLLTTEGWLAIAWEVPCGLEWDTNLPILDGQEPDSLTIQDQDSLSLITFFFDLPLTTSSDEFTLGFEFLCNELCTPDQACIDSLITACPISNCETDPPPTLPIFVTTTLWEDLDAPAACQIQACDALVANYNCIPDSICLDTIAGYGLFEFSFQRASLGFADDNDDRWPDSNELADPDLIRLDRSIAGDTLRFQANGVVVGELPDASFATSILNIDFRPQGISPDIAAELLNPDDGLVLIDLAVEIFDQSQNSVFNCDGIAVTIDSSQEFIRYQIPLSDSTLASCGLPTDYLWQNGDSLRVEALFRQEYNPQNPPGSPFPPLLLVSVQPEWALGETTNDPAPFSCGCESQLWEISGYRTQIIPGVFTLSPCDTSSYSGANYLAFELAQGNFFPFEYRPLFRIDSLQFGFPASLNLQESRIQRLGHQGGPDWKVDTVLAGNFINGQWYYQLDSCQYPAADEGVRLLFQHRFAPECPFPVNADLTVTAKGSLLRSLPDADTILTEIGTGNLKALLPNLLVIAPQPTQISFDNQVSWLIDVFNNVNTVIGQESGTAPNVWIQLFSPSGLITDLQLTDTLSGLPIPEINGFFQLGNLDSLSTVALLIEGLNQSCETEFLEVRYGWDCEPVSNTVDARCFESSIELSVLSPDGQLALAVNGPDSCSALCDTVPYHTLTLSNIDLGALCDLSVTLELPLGLELLPGSVELAIPAASSFFPIPDPTDQGGGIWQYALDSLSADLAANCLPGVLTDPNHTLQIRFLALSNCDFTVNERIRATASGFQRCGTPANTVSALGPPLCLITDGPDPFTQFNAGLDEAIICQDTATLNLVFAHSESTTSLDTFLVILPPGLAYIPFSQVDVVNAPNEEPFLDTLNNQQRLQWAFPAGLSPFSVVALQVKLAGFAEQDCGAYEFPVHTFGYQNALCLSSGDTCLVRYQYGSSTINYSIERPTWELSDFTFDLLANPDSGTYSVQITNTSLASPQAMSLSLYYDWNGNSFLDPGDSILQTFSLIGPQTDTLLQGSWNGDPANLCYLRAATRGDLHCSCEDDDIGLSFPISTPVIELDSICPGIETPLSLPLCLNGFEVAWGDPGGVIICDTCCSTEIIWSNFSDTAWIQNQFTASLTATDDCQFNIPFQVQVSPSPGIWDADTLACTGETIQLAAFPAQGYSWTGPGISNPELPIQMIQATNSSWFFLEAETSVDCTTTDSVFVTVLPLPQVEAGPDTVFCPGTSAQLNGVAPSSVSVQWEPVGALSNPGQLSTGFTGEQTGWYTLHVLDANGCQSQDSVFVEFGSYPTLSISSDTTICLGDSLTIEASGALAYDWITQEPFICLTGNCDAIQVTPTTTDTILLSGTNEQGCSTEIAVVVTVADESVLTQDTLTTCLGSPIDIFGNLTDVSGTYCDTLVLASGCRQIACITLMAQDTFFTSIDTSLCLGDSLLFGNVYLSEPGTYFDLQETSLGCDSLIQVNLQFYPSPNLIALAEPPTILEGETSVLSTNIPILEPIWVPDSALSCVACLMSEASPEITTTYSISGLDDFGCLLSADVTLSVSRDCNPNRIELPNIFTPDGDGRNDTFFPLTQNGEEQIQSFRIWNRWGQLVHKEPQAWDGSHRGKPLPMDTYLYQIVMVCPDEGTEAIHRGEIILIR